MKCMFCGSSDVARERRPDGDDHCNSCGKSWPSREYKAPPEVIDINKNKPHFTGLALCLDCKKTWVATVPANTELFSLECPNFGHQNSFFSFVPIDYLEAGK